MKNRTVIFILLAMAALFGIAVALWPTMRLELDGTAKVVVENWGTAEITDTETLSQIIEALDGACFYKTFARAEMDNYDPYWLRFYNADGNALLSEQKLFISNGQLLWIGEDWKLWRSMRSVDSTYYELLLQHTE